MKDVKFTYSRQRLFPGFDKIQCKTCPHLAYDGDKTMFMTYGFLLLTGCDVGYGAHIAKSTDGGLTFGEPKPLEFLKDSYENGVRYAKGGSPYYNRFHKKWYGLGRIQPFPDDSGPLAANGFAVGGQLIQMEFDPDKGDFTSWKPLEFPWDSDSAVIMHVLELDNGDILVPFQFAEPTDKRLKAAVVRYTLTEDGLKIVEAGEPITDAGLDFTKFTFSPTKGTANRGTYEPGLATLNGKYYVTLRNDEVGLWARSDDGLHFEKPQPWRWDDGSVLENYNTMQRWMTGPDGIFLAYTRKGANNDHVFRHRAPMFMARFDEDRGCLIKDTEVILVPELGARLGNFTTLQISDSECWLATAEWMQGPGGWEGCMSYGSDNSIWIARAKWEK